MLALRLLTGPASTQGPGGKNKLFRLFKKLITIGRGATGSEGRAANLFAWTVLVDPAQLASAADVDFARQLVARWNPGHCRGYLAVKATGGSPYAVFSDPNSRFDGAIFG